MYCTREINKEREKGALIVFVGLTVSGFPRTHTGDEKGRKAKHLKPSESSVIVCVGECVFVLCA